MKSFATILSLASYTAAHATFQALWVGAQDEGSSCVRLPATNSPMSNVNSPDMRCNAGARPAAGVCAVAGIYTDQYHINVRSATY